MSSTNKIDTHIRNGSSKEKTSNQSSSSEYQLKNQLLLLATLVATVTYAAGLNLPGGFWQDTHEDHLAGDPILPGNHKEQYIMFYYCNATAFAASLVVCLLLLVLDKKNSRCAAALRVVMVFDLLGLMGAYAAGSCRDEFTTIYSSVIMSVVFAYIVPSLFTYAVSKLKKKGKNPAKQNKDPGELKDTEKQNGYPGEHNREELHEVLMLLATFAVTITYVAGLNPPGGFWGSTQDGHRVSNPVLQDINSRRYKAFFVCNTTAFVASLLIIMLLLDKRVNKEQMSLQFGELYGSIVVALFGLVGAYAAGSCREPDDTVYVICLIAAILAYIFLQVAVTQFLKMSYKNDRHTESKRSISSVKSLIHNEQDLDGSRYVSKSPPISFSFRNCNFMLYMFPITRNTKHNVAMEKARSLVMLLATLAASITYQAGLDPPGGLWPDDRDGHKGGDPILLTTHPTRYKVFFYSNSVAFVTSLVAIILVKSNHVLKNHTLEAAMLLDLFALICAYAAGSCRDVSTSIYVVALAGGVLVYVVIHIIFFTLDNMDSEHHDPDEEDKKREVLLLLAILVATLTYQAGLTPPGGFWLEDDNLGHHHQAGFPILLENYPPHYEAFFYCNATSFMASIALIILLVNPNLYRPGIKCYALYVCMVAGMFGLMGAYAAGSSRHLRTSIYVLTLVGAIFALVALQVVIFWNRNRHAKTAGRNADSSAQEGGSTDTEASQPEPLIKGKGSSSQATEITDIADAALRDCDKGEGSFEQGGRRINYVTSEPRAHGTGNRSSLQEANSEEDKSGSTDKDMREYLMLLGVLAASVTYQAGLKPPGGLWQENSNGHLAGHYILHDINKRRYYAFFYSNSISFMSSIVVIALLLPRMLNNLEIPVWPMHTAILLDMLGLLCAYAAGSTMEWKTSRNIIALVIPVLVYMAAYAALSFFRKEDQKQISASTCQASTNS
uniref:PGG domain-containing protein n=1 Tax=Oryza punctata TaxID=4537 RepID=A0A0E0LAL7_ORYPU